MKNRLGKLLSCVCVGRRKKISVSNPLKIAMQSREYYYKYRFFLRPNKIIKISYNRALRCYLKSINSYLLVDLTKTLDVRE